jgi:hypothetical protein
VLTDHGLLPLCKYAVFEVSTYMCQVLGFNMLVAWFSACSYVRLLTGYQTNTCIVMQQVVTPWFFLPSYVQEAIS